MYDSANHFIHFWIDRNSKGIATAEEFEGRFIDPSKTIYKESKYSIDCSSQAKDKKPYMLLLTSKKTGRQTVVFQARE